PPHALGLLCARRKRPRCRGAAERSQQFPPSDGDCHTPLPCEVRKRKNTTPRVSCPNSAAPGVGAYAVVRRFSETLSPANAGHFLRREPSPASGICFAREERREVLRECVVREERREALRECVVREERREASTKKD